MTKFEEIRRRLAGLATDGVESIRSSPGEALAACRSLRAELRELKQEVLAELAALRARAMEHARRSLDTGPSEESPDSRVVRAMGVLADVRQRVKGLLDDKGTAAVEAWAEIHREIDRRLDRLAELEGKLARAAGKGDAPALPAADRPGVGRREKPDDGDDLYAAVGAAVQKGSRPGAFCSHCGQGVEPDDRFCRRCGHRL